MNRNWTDLLRRDIRIPPWCAVGVLIVSLGLIVAPYWQASARRAAQWRAETRRSPSHLADYRFFDASTLHSLQQANEQLIEHLSSNNPSGAVARNELACIYAIQGNEKHAAVLFREALAAHKKMLGENHDDTQIIQHNLAALVPD
jgi:Tfp pilus assembly protein PilF